VEKHPEENRPEIIKKEKNKKKTYSVFNDDIFNSKIISEYIQYTKNNEATNFTDLFGEKKYDNNKNNSCFINLILNTYQEPFLKYEQRGGNIAFLTYKTLCDILEVENKDQDIGLTITQSHKFFDKYSLGLDIDL